MEQLTHPVVTKIPGVFVYCIMTDSAYQNQNAPPSKLRRLNGPIAILIILAALAMINYKPSIKRIHCDDAILSTKPEVVMLGTWWCKYCYQARRYFTTNNINYCEYDIERSAEGERLYHRVNAQAVPVFLVDQYVISGFDEERLKQLLDKVREST
ncbi:MAG: glutaredoxin domain-containing protein [Gammaproteobacteria bacterium]|jgi:glutaredoxin